MPTRARQMVKVPRLNVRAKLVRRHWAQKHINRPLDQWQHVIFCDESRFVLFWIDNRVRVRRLVGEAMNKDCTHGNVAHGGGSSSSSFIHNIYKQIHIHINDKFAQYNTLIVKLDNMKYVQVCICCKVLYGQ